MMAKEGDKAVVKKNPAKRNEYRDKIGPAAEAFLVFKGETKIGMIPHEFIAKMVDTPFKKVCRIAKMNPSLDVIVVDIYIQDVAATQ